MSDLGVVQDNGWDRVERRSGRTDGRREERGMGQDGRGSTFQVRWGVLLGVADRSLGWDRRGWDGGVV